jgi:hypothetical protein
MIEQSYRGELERRLMAIAAITMSPLCQPFKHAPPLEAGI